MMKEKQAEGLTKFELIYRGDNHELWRPLLKYRKSQRKHAQKAYSNDDTAPTEEKNSFHS